MKLLREDVKLLRAHVKGITRARKKFPKIFFHHVPLGAPYLSYSTINFNSFTVLLDRTKDSILYTCDHNVDHFMYNMKL